jgi:hypothetical protein
VLTRIGGVATGRRVLARSGGLALEALTETMDVTIDSGFAAPSARLDPSGDVWASTMPLRFVVTGNDGGHDYLGVRFTVSTPVGVVAGAGSRWALHGQHLTVCAPVEGAGRARVVTFRIASTPLAGPAARGAYPEAQIGVGVMLTETRVAGGSCPFQSDLG